MEAEDLVRALRPRRQLFMGNNSTEAIIRHTLLPLKVEFTYPFMVSRYQGSCSFVHETRYSNS